MNKDEVIKIFEPLKKILQINDNHFILNFKKFDVCFDYNEVREIEIIMFTYTDSILNISLDNCSWLRYGFNKSEVE